MRIKYVPKQGILPRILHKIQKIRKKKPRNRIRVSRVATLSEHQLNAGFFHLKVFFLTNSSYNCLCSFKKVHLKTLKKLFPNKSESIKKSSSFIHKIKFLQKICTSIIYNFLKKIQISYILVVILHFGLNFFNYPSRL